MHDQPEWCGAPFKTVMTHGFVLDEKGRKMSKSLGNVISPQEIIDKYGCDILRLWVVSCDYTNDMRIGPNILKQQEDIYRRYRNTLRYLLGALEGFAEDEKVTYEQMPDLEHWVLHQLAYIQEKFMKAIEDYEIQSLYEALHFFCRDNLSAFYFDLRKDVLYCDDPKSLMRRSARTVMDIVFQAIVHWLTPVLCFTAEEAWKFRYNGQKGSIKLSTLPDFICNSPQTWKNEGLREKYNLLRDKRSFLNKQLEYLRKLKVIGSSLDAEVLIYDPQELFSKDVDWPEMFTVSKVTIDPTPKILEKFSQDPERSIRGKGFGGPNDLEDSIEWCVQPAPGTKCQRCYKILEEVGHQPHYDDLCERCAAVVHEYYGKGKND